MLYEAVKSLASEDLGENEMQFCKKQSSRPESMERFRKFHNFRLLKDAAKYAWNSKIIRIFAQGEIRLTPKNIATTSPSTATENTSKKNPR